jgi:DNA-directed RNA polymerase beta subunit
MRNSALQFICLNEIGHFVDLSSKITFIVNGVRKCFLNFLHLSQQIYFIAKKSKSTRNLGEFCNPEFSKTFSDSGTIETKNLIEQKYMKMEKFPSMFK